MLCLLCKGTETVDGDGVCPKCRFQMESEPLHEQIRELIGYTHADEILIMIARDSMPTIEFIVALRAARIHARASTPEEPPSRPTETNAEPSRGLTSGLTLADWVPRDKRDLVDWHEEVCQ